jgi:hypothetical protein
VERGEGRRGWLCTVVHKPWGSAVWPGVVWRKAGQGRK